MQTQAQIEIREALISARERFRLMIEQYKIMDEINFAMWAEFQAIDGLNEADKALSKPGD